MPRRSKQTLGLLLMTGALVMLGGCAVSSPSGPGPAPSGADPGYGGSVAESEVEAGDGPLDGSDQRLVERVELPALLEVVFERNPRIRKARSAWKAALERVPQVTALPDPTVQILHFVRSVETRVGPQENVFSFSQKIPWPGKLILAGEVAEEAVRIEALRYSAAVRDVLVETKIAYHEYVYLTRAKDLVEQNVSIARRLAGLGSDLYSEDKALLIDVLKAQSQLAQLDYDLITLAELISAERTRINGLLGSPPEAPLGAPAGASFPRVRATVEELYGVAAANREELRIADRLIAKAAAEEDLARSRYVPDLTIGGTYVQVDENRPPLMQPSDNGKDAVGLMVGITVPLWVNRISAGVREARARKEAAVQGKAETRNDTFTSLKDAYFKLTNAERLVLLYRDSLIPQAKQVMLSTEERAREDRMRLGDYLEAQTVWLNFTLARERALADYNQAIARIERLTGAALAPDSEGAAR